MSRRVLITGGAGFVGANVAVGLAVRHPDWTLVALDNLRRRGSELNLPRLREHGVAFVHGDVRVLDDVLGVGELDAIVECSAEPSVLAGGDYVVQSNLVGAYHCLELARRRGADLVFLSSSRVYPVAALEALAYVETESRFELLAEQPLAGRRRGGHRRGLPARGRADDLRRDQARRRAADRRVPREHGLRAVVNRCGVIAGPWQMGKVDQGVFTHWMLAHHFGQPLRYIGYGGSGKQVRDLLHVEDLVALIERQLLDPEHWSGVTVNVGGGRECSLSLRETTALCARDHRAHVAVEPSPAPRPGDVPVYLSDCARLHALTDWRPRHDPRDDPRRHRCVDQRARGRAARVALSPAGRAARPSARLCLAAGAAAALPRAPSAGADSDHHRLRRTDRFRGDRAFRARRLPRDRDRERHARVVLRTGCVDRAHDRSGSSASSATRSPR